MEQQKIITELQVELYTKVYRLMEKIKELDSNEETVDILTLIKNHINQLQESTLEYNIAQTDEIYNDYFTYKILIFDELSSRLKKNLILYSNESQKKELDYILSRYLTLNENYKILLQNINHPGNSNYTKRMINNLHIKLENLKKNLDDKENSIFKELSVLEIKEIYTRIEEKEKLLLKQIIFEHNQLIEKREKETYKKRIKKVISILDKESETLKKHLQDLNNDKFVFGGFGLLGIFTSIFLFYSYVVEINNINELKHFLDSKKYFINYLILIFPIIFSTVFGLLFLRQYNKKSEDIYILRKKLMVYEEINKSINALIELSNLSDLKIKVEKIITDLIKNVILYSNHSENKVLKEENNLDKLDEKMTSILGLIEKNSN